jgi:hypothetical protein
MTDIYHSRIPNPDYNTLITQYANNYEKQHKQGLSRLHKSMLKYVHNLLHYQKGFKRSDLKQFYEPKITTKDGFDNWIGQFISKMKQANIIYDLNSNRPKTYSLRGIHLDSITEQDTASVTSENDLINIVKEIMLTEKPQIHNVNASFWLSDDTLYQKLERMYHEQITGIDFNKSNKQITCKLDKPLGLSRIAIFLVYPNNRVDIRLGCTDNPFDFNYSGIAKIMESMLTAILYLKLKSGKELLTQDITEWLVNSVDLNHDSSFTDRTNSIRIKHLFGISAKVDELSQGKIKVYPHKNKDTGQTKTRVEYDNLKLDLPFHKLFGLSDEYEQDIEREKQNKIQEIRDKEESQIQDILHKEGDKQYQINQNKQEDIEFCSTYWPKIECFCGYHKF